MSNSESSSTVNPSCNSEKREGKQNGETTQTDAR